jgi:GT2 family glycosyltransferase
VSTNPPLVYVIVLTWNGRKFTLECLRSLYQSDYSNYRVLLVDNASTDGTVDAVRGEFPQTELIANESNEGYAEGNNIGIRQAEKQGASFFFVLNNDTVVDRSTISQFVQSAKGNEDNYVFTPVIYDYDSRDRVVFWGNSWDPSRARFRQLPYPNQDFLQKTDFISSDFASGCAIFFSRSILKRVGLLDPRYFIYWEDTDWSMRALRNHCRIFVVPQAKIWHSESQSFQDASGRIAFHYYHSRNRLLWIEKNLKGFTRLHALFRSVKFILQPFHPRFRSELIGRTQVLRARLLGFWHYLNGKFGPFVRS